MASNGRVPGDQETTSNPSEPPASRDDSQNPFVRFKHFADAQAAITLKGLQSIVGLPSSITQAQNQKWTHWEEELRKRDAAKDKEESCQQSTPNMAYEGEQELLDLMMPLSNIITIDDDSKFSSYGISENLFLWLPRIYRIRPAENQHKTALGQIQKMVYDVYNPNPWESVTLLPPLLLPSHPSVLPYLLFSKYSPLWLTFKPPVHSIGSMAVPPREPFPYAAAFEDLLRASAGEPMRDLKAISRSYDVNWTPRFQYKHTAEGNAYRGAAWLSRFQIVGLRLYLGGPNGVVSTLDANDKLEIEEAWPYARSLPRRLRCLCPPPETELELYYALLNESDPDDSGAMPNSSYKAQTETATAVARFGSETAFNHGTSWREEEMEADRYYNNDDDDDDDDDEDEVEEEEEEEEEEEDNYDDENCNTEEAIFEGAKTLRGDSQGLQSDFTRAIRTQNQIRRPDGVHVKKESYTTIGSDGSKHTSTTTTTICTYEDGNVETTTVKESSTPNGVESHSEFSVVGYAMRELGEPGEAGSSRQRASVKESSTPETQPENSEDEMAVKNENPNTSVIGRRGEIPNPLLKSNKENEKSKKKGWFWE